MVIGVTPAVTPGVGNPGVLRELEEELASRLGESVQVRSFDSEAAQLDWLIRFRELDAALVSRGLLHTLPAGTLLQLADLPAAVVVTHPGVPAARQEKLSRAFRNLLEDERGRQVMNRLTATANVAATPKAEPARRSAQPVAPAPSKPAAAAAMESRPVVPKLTPKPPASKPAGAAPSQPAALPTAPITTTTPPAAPAMAPSSPATALPPAKAPAQQPVAVPVPAKAQPPVPAAAAVPPAEPSSPKRTRLLLLAMLVVMIGIGVKIILLMRHWKQKKKGPNTLSEPPDAKAFEFLTGSDRPVPTPLPRMPLSPQATSTMAADDKAWHQKNVETEPASASAAAGVPETLAEPAPQRRPASNRKTVQNTAGEIFPSADDALVVEQGQLGKIKVPALLKRCADLPQPVILRVRSGDNETCIHFAAGQICHAYSRNWRVEEETRQWNKLGYLMVRDGLISETQRDRALELLDRQPGLRFAAALQKLEALDLEALRHILARQAKTTVFVLILFYSGDYRVEMDSGTIPAEESISLQVEALIREASHHQAEWTAIRKVLPTLGTLLDFAPDGREKLEQVRLSVHQQLLLSQVDGLTSVGTLCSDSTMMDYEACRFLYLMVKAGVLQVAPAA